MLAMFLAMATAFAATFNHSWTISVDPSAAGRTDVVEFEAYADPLLFGAADRTIQSSWSPLKCYLESEGVVRLSIRRTSAAWLNPPAAGATCTTTEAGHTHILTVFFQTEAAHTTSTVTGTPFAGPVTFALKPNIAALSRIFEGNTGHTYTQGKINATGPGAGVECRVWQPVAGSTVYVVNAVAFDSPAGNYTCTLPRVLGGVNSTLVYTVTVTR